MKYKDQSQSWSLLEEGKNQDQTGLLSTNQCVLPKQETEKLEGLSNQTSLDSFVETTPNVKWSQQGLLEHIMDFVVSDDQVSIVYDYFYPFISKLFFSHSMSLT